MMQKKTCSNKKVILLVDNAGSLRTNNLAVKCNVCVKLFLLDAFLTDCLQLFDDCFNTVNFQNYNVAIGIKEAQVFEDISQACVCNQML